MSKTNITLLTSSAYLTANKGDWYVENIIEDDRLLRIALEKQGLSVSRINWDNPKFNWTETKYIIIRTPWDYFNRYAEFSNWFEETAKITQFINSYEIIKWNIDKHYMLELKTLGINIPDTIFIEQGEKRTLKEITSGINWDEFILKPAISGGAWNTFRFSREKIENHELIYKKLIKDNCMMLQEFQHTIISQGEVSYMIFGGKFTHAVLKNAKGGDYRVQDDYGGSVHDYNPSNEEIIFAEQAVNLTKPGIPYARVDVMRDNNGKLSVGELELFEPELWFRKYPPSADIFAEIVSKMIKV
ncbi:MAG: hypothetical protein IT280_09475 [Ignavibacteria bacterium]|nr:hypothetical protein [Ignavibacteria bacterium]